MRCKNLALSIIITIILLQSRAATPKQTISINLQKLHTSTIQTLAEEEQALESELPTYRTDLLKPRLPSNLVSPRRKRPIEADTPRRPSGVLHPFFNPVGGLEVAEEIGDDDLPRVHFRLSGVRPELLHTDATTRMILHKTLDGCHVRDADNNYHKRQLYAPRPKRTPHQFINNDQRYFSRVQGTMNLSCLLAVERAYKERERAEKSMAKIEKIVQHREQREAARRRVQAYKDEKRMAVILERQKDKVRALEVLEQQELHRLHYLDKAQELRERAQRYKQSMSKEQTFVHDFTTQQTSISQALLKHDRASRADDRQRSLVEFVARHRDEELEQQDLVRKYLDHRQTMRQAESTVHRATIDTRLLHETSERLQHAHARVDQLRELKNKAKQFCPLTASKTLPPDDRSQQSLRGLDKWNTTVSVSSGRVGKHPTVFVALA